MLGSGRAMSAWPTPDISGTHNDDSFRAQSGRWVPHDFGGPTSDDSPSAPLKQFKGQFVPYFNKYLRPSLTLRGSGSSPAVRAPVYHWRAEGGGGEFASLKGLQVLTIDLAREGFASPLALASDTHDLAIRCFAALRIVITLIAQSPICSPQYPNLRRARCRSVPMGLCPLPLATQVRSRTGSLLPS
jgi:hypothetical protein